MTHKVSVRKIKDINKIESYLQDILKDINWEKYIKGKNIFIKINATSAEFFPGRNTAPWIIEPFLKILKKRYSGQKIFMGDTNVAGSKQFNTAVKIWGYDKLAKRYGVKLVNLDETELVPVNINGVILKKTLLPKVIIESDTIINIPILKTHCLSVLTCCLKNLWGLLPRTRHRYHEKVHQVIADINRYFKKCTLNIVDATIAMEGNGPKIGTPKICNIIFATPDRVAGDSYACDLTGLNRNEVKSIFYSEKRGVGKSEYKLVGDKINCLNFKKSTLKGDPVSFIEMHLRKVPILKNILFNTKLFQIAGFLGTNYNYYISYLLKGGKQTAENLIYNSEYSVFLKKIKEKK